MIDRAGVNTQVNASHHLESPMEELDVTNSHASGPYFGKSMMPLQKPHQGTTESSRPMKAENYDDKKMALIQTKGTPMQSQGMHS